MVTVLSLVLLSLRLTPLRADADQAPLTIDSTTTALQSTATWEDGKTFGIQFAFGAPMTIVTEGVALSGAEDRPFTLPGGVKAQLPTSMYLVLHGNTSGCIILGEDFLAGRRLLLDFKKRTVRFIDGFPDPADVLGAPNPMRIKMGPAPLRGPDVVDGVTFGSNTFWSLARGHLCGEVNGGLPTDVADPSIDGQFGTYGYVGDSHAIYRFIDSPLGKMPVLLIDQRSPHALANLLPLSLFDGAKLYYDGPNHQIFTDATRTSCLSAMIARWTGLPIRMQDDKLIVDCQDDSPVSQSLKQMGADGCVVTAFSKVQAADAVRGLNGDQSALKGLSDVLSKSFVAHILVEGKDREFPVKR